MAHKSSRIAAPDRRQQILSVAMELFARRGFRGTTTRQIAERAHVNEAILFRHFPRKEDLYWAILDGKCRGAGGRQELEAKLGASAGDMETFAAIAEGILRRNTEDATLGRLLLFSALEHHRLSHRFFRIHVANYYETLALYIRQRIRAGAFRRVDPLLAARGFLGMVVYHFLIQELFGGRRYQKFERRRVCRTLAEIWLEGMRVPQTRPGGLHTSAAAVTLPPRGHLKREARCAGGIQLGKGRQMRESATSMCRPLANRAWKQEGQLKARRRS